MPKTCLSLLVLITAMVWSCYFSPVGAQEMMLDEVAPLYDSEPFTRITLDQANDFAKIDVYPLKDTSSATVRVQRLQDPPDRLFDISQSNISKIESFGDVLLGEVVSLLGERKTDEAFLYLDRLVREFPNTQGLDGVIEQYYMLDAGLLFRSKRFDESLLVLDQVYSRNPNREELTKVLPQVVEQTIQILFNEGDYSGARRAVNYAAERYGKLTAEIVSSWTTRLQSKAKEQLDRARRFIRSGEPTQALAASRLASQIWPNLPGAEAIRQEILAQYPRVTVGVTQRFVSDVSAPRRGPDSMNWAARRTGRLVRRKLVELEAFTADGGRYESPTGKLAVSSDRRRVNLTLKNYTDTENSGYVVARALLKIANPESKFFDVRWAEYLESVYLPAPNTVELTFTRATMRPEAVLPNVALGADDPVQTILAGDFVEEPSQEAGAQHFVLRAKSPITVKEIVEISYKDFSAATAALLRGEVDVVDRLHPSDVYELRSNSDVVVTPYRIPTLHALAFNSREPLIRSTTFRQGMLYSINRQGFLKNELGGSRGRQIAEIISGLLPIGISDDDPLGYAYNKKIEAREFDPQLGLVLMRLAQSQLTQAKSAQEPIDPADAKAESESTDDAISSDSATQQPPLPALVLAYPDSPIAQAASSAIASDLRRIGMQITLRGLDPGTSRPDDGDWDLLYLEATIQEPFVDVPELVVGEGILGRQGGLVWQAVRSIQESLDLADVRNRFATVHQLSFDHTPLLPLWQIIEHAAYRKHLHGVGGTPVTLYQNVNRWRLGP